MNEHLVFFIDFLGFAQAVRERDEKRLAILANLLRNLAALRSEFSLTQRREESGATHSDLTPSITTFSDNIVISYPTEHILKLAGEDSFSFALHGVLRLIGPLAAAAMGVGLLIRGGATVGQLYHSGGVVIGKAMVEAYELESRTAIYPRIAVSRKLYSRVQTNARPQLLLEDRDGITHLNYFWSMIWAGGGGVGQPGDQFKQRLNAWLANARHTVAENIGRFEQDERWNELAKWAWFRNSLEQARANYNNALFE